MQKGTKIILSLLLLFLIALSGCGKVTSFEINNTGDIKNTWYVRTNGFKYQIFYCPKPETKKPPKCYQAVIHKKVL